MSLFQDWYSTRIVGCLGEEMTDLFNCYGDPIDLKDPTKYGNGYAAAPGSGPDGETCGTCKHLVVKEYANKYFKCGIGKITGGAGTDIRKKSLACHKWSKDCKP